ncbi:LysR family transcriptional regulator [Streptomyces sp. NPDC018347]|uniref:LysR family transcriptional regulator n=1 Tax=Streptomyces sp. NPDC018347 TaxID=3157193 RepID=UPI0033D0B51A
MLDVRRLRILHHLATYGTVAAAAEALHLTAPAVSQQLAVLEREAGMPVVEKHGRTLRLTTAGELLVAHAEVVLGDLAAAESDLAALRGGRRGQVRVAAFASAARTLLPAVYRALAEEDGEWSRLLTLDLTVLEPDQALDALRKREVDMAVVHGYTVLPRDFPSGSEQDVLMQDPVVALLRPDHAAHLGLAPGEAVDLADLADESWLTPGPDTSCYEMIQRTCGASGFVPEVRVRSSDFAVLTSLVAAGAGVALAPLLAVPDDTCGVGLHPLAVPVSRTVFAVSRSGTARRPDIHLLCSLLARAAAGHPAAL